VKKLLSLRSIAAEPSIPLLPCIAMLLAFTSLPVAAQSSSVSSPHPSAQVESRTDHNGQDTSVPAKIFLETGHAGMVNALTFSSNGQWLVSAGQDRTIKVWDVARMRVVRTLTGHSDEVMALAFSPDGKLLASCSKDGTIRLWNAAGDWDSSILVGTGVPIFSVVFSHDGHMVISGDLNGVIVGRDVRTGAELVRLTDQCDVHSLAVSPVQNNILASGTNWLLGPAVHLWDLSTKKQMHALAGNIGAVDKVAFSPDGKVLLARGQQEGYKAWDVYSGKELQRARTDPRNLIGFTPEGGLLTSAPGSVYLSKDWTGTDERETKGFSSMYVTANFRDKFLASSASLGGEVHLWEISTGHELSTTLEPRDVTSGIAISPDGRLLASVNGFDVQLWNLLDSTAAVLTKPQYDMTSNQTVTFSQDGKSLATWGFSNTFSIWDVASGRKRFTATHEGTLNCVAFRPGSDELASASDDHTIRIWNTHTGKLLNTIPATAAKSSPSRLPPMELGCCLTAGNRVTLIRTGCHKLETDMHSRYGTPVLDES
jgi:WD40 repeat protein